MRDVPPELFLTTQSSQYLETHRISPRRSGSTRPPCVSQIAFSPNRCSFSRSPRSLLSTCSRLPTSPCHILPEIGFDDCLTAWLWPARLNNHNDFVLRSILNTICRGPRSPIFSAGRAASSLKRFSSAIHNGAWPVSGTSNVMEHPRLGGCSELVEL